MGARRTDTAQDSRSLNRWKAARRLTLGAILLAGSMAASASAVQQIAQKEAQQPRSACATTVYSGIGVTIGSRGGSTYITQVNPQGPAQGVLRPGAVLIRADESRPATLVEWKGALTGQPGTSVEIEVAYPDRGHEIVTIERAVVRARRL